MGQSVKVSVSPEWQPPDISHLPESDRMKRKIISSMDETERIQQLQDAVNEVLEDLPGWVDVNRAKIFDSSDLPEGLPIQQDRILYPRLRDDEERDNSVAYLNVDADSGSFRAEVAEKLVLDVLDYVEIEYPEKAVDSSVFGEIDQAEEVFKTFLGELTRKRYAEEEISPEWRFRGLETLEGVKEEVNRETGRQNEMLDTIERKLEQGQMEELWKLSQEMPEVNLPLEGEFPRTASPFRDVSQALWIIEEEDEVGDGVFDEYRAGYSVDAVLEIVDAEMDEIDRIEHGDPEGGYRLEDGVLTVSEEFQKEWRNGYAQRLVQHAREEVERYRESFKSNPDFWLWKQLTAESAPLTDDYGEEFPDDLTDFWQPVGSQTAALLEESTDPSDVIMNPEPYAEFVRDAIAMSYLSSDTDETQYRRSLEKAAERYNLLN